jgi:hypothetical protein
MDASSMASGALWRNGVGLFANDPPWNCTAVSRLFDPNALGPPDQEDDWPFGREGIGGAAHGAVERHPNRATAMSTDRSPPPLPYL